VAYRRPGSPELAAAVVEAMREHNSILLLKHGQVTCGKDFNQAFERAMFLEMACRIAILTHGEFTTLDKDELNDIHSVFGV
jgi:ribulose-5-phosphate 4-epimerase/fuculose-1-phosphate aldolase